MLRIGQVEATATQDGKYTDGSVAGGIAATRLRAAAFNAMQEELAHIVESAGLALDINDMTQVLKAIQKLTLSRANPFADIKSDGAAAISTALTNLGLGAGAPAIGIPFFWPSSAMPITVMTEWADMVFLKFNGATFSAATYPKLALVFPGLVLTEARGEFLRIWDDGRGVDAGRGLLSAQGHAYQSHSHRLLMSAGSVGSGNVIGIDGSLNGTLTYNINQPGGGQIQAIENAGGTETRPRNIAFNFLVRAK
ncbi:TPA: phage tail protein [Enterobacter asburiae]|nr:phage tail protein [Enterobacter asburiae]